MAPSSRQSVRHPSGGRVLADGWYSWVATPDAEHPWTTFSAVLDRLPGPLARFVLGHGVLRGLALALVSSRYDVVAMNRYDPGWRSLLLARALLGRRRKLVVFHFFDHPARRTFAGLLWRTVDRWAVRRTLARAQVLTAVELAAYPGRFGVGAERFALVRFAARISPRGDPPPTFRANGPVVAAGRAHCDWETLFAAAAGRGWDLQVVCSAEDRERVAELNARHRAGAQISVELGQPETHALLSRAAISVICVSDGLLGRGHIRLAEATDTGAAIVASDVVSLHGYVEPALTAVLVPPGDPAVLRSTVEVLMRHPDRRASLAANAYARAASWTAGDYVAALQALAAAATSATDAGAPGAD
jgi:hypothetical protein